MLEKIYWILKTKLHFDDIQAATTISSLILLPISFYLGILNINAFFTNVFYITIGLDLLVVAYSIIKVKYFRDIREKEKNAAKEIAVKDLSIIDSLSGRDFEKFAIEYFKLYGYRIECTQTSHDNGADILAYKGNNLICIEAKRRIKKINRHVVLSVHYAMEYIYKGDKAVIFTNNVLTDQARATAKDKGVEYIDRYDLEKFFRKNTNIIINSKN